MNSAKSKAAGQFGNHCRLHPLYITVHPPSLALAIIASTCSFGAPCFMLCSTNSSTDTWHRQQLIQQQQRRAETAATEKQQAEERSKMPRRNSRKFSSEARRQSRRQLNRQRAGFTFQHLSQTVTAHLSIFVSIDRLHCLFVLLLARPFT